MKNVTPHPLNILATLVGICLILVGGWLIYSDFETLLKFLKLFAGFFLLLFGLSILLTSLRVRFS